MSSVIPENEVAHKDPVANLQDATVTVPDIAPVKSAEELYKAGVGEEELGEDEDDEEDRYSNLSMYDDILDADPDGFVYPTGKSPLAVLFHIYTIILTMHRGRQGQLYSGRVCIAPQTPARCWS
jgi:hypothetical protein